MGSISPTGLGSVHGLSRVFIYIKNNTHLLRFVAASFSELGSGWYAEGM